LAGRNGRTSYREGTGRLDVAVLDAVLRQSVVVVRSLGRKGLRVGAFDAVSDAPAFASRWCHVHGVLPSALSADAERYDSALAELLDDWTPSVIITAHDGTIEMLRARRSEIEKRSRVALAVDAALETAVDKERTLLLARRLAVPVPRTAAVADVAEVGQAVAEVGLPAVVKPTRSWVGGEIGGRRLGPLLVTTVREAEHATAKLLQPGASAMVQEWVPGIRESVLTFYADGAIVASFALRVLRAYPALGGSSVLRESIPLAPELADSAQRLVATANLEGVAEVEFRRDRENRPVLMEINPRLPATAELAFRAGIDFPWLLYRWAAGESLPRVVRYRTGVRLRWLAGDLLWLSETLRTQGRPGVDPATRAIGAFVGDFFTASSYDLACASDLRPRLVAIKRSLTRWSARRSIPED
jgi:predicted ATP-grasp superfamily ATP-dependent carboligase